MSGNSLKGKSIALLLVVLLSIVYQPAMAFETIMGKTVSFESELLQEKFSDFDLYNIDSERLSQIATENRGQNLEFGLMLGDDYYWYISLEENELRSFDYIHRDINVENSTVSGFDDRPCKTYKGLEANGLAQSLRMTIAPEQIYGYFAFNEEAIYMEPLSLYDAEAPADAYVVYKENDVIDPQEIDCGIDVSDHIDYDKFDETAPGKGDDSEDRNSSCKTVDLAIAADYSMTAKFSGNLELLENHILSLLNFVEPLYSQFYVDFQVTNFQTYSGMDPFSTTTEPYPLLIDFSNWGEGPYSFDNPYDVATMWTNRNIDGATVGYAYVSAVCTQYRYNVLQHYSTIMNKLVVLWAHELGHNFGAQHDPAGSNSIMAPSINPDVTQFSSTSYYAIHSHIDSRTCLEDCSSTPTFNCTNYLVAYEDYLMSGNTASGSNSASTYNCTATSLPGNELIYLYEHSGGELTATLSAVAGSNLDIMVLNACGVNSCVAYGDNTLSVDLEPGMYYIIVDGQDTYTGTFNLMINSEGVVVLNQLNCANAYQIYNGSAFSHTTYNYGNNVSSYNCSSVDASGDEFIHIYNHTGGILNATLSNISGDFDVYLLSACDAGECIAYGEYMINEELAAGSYYIIVDGKNGTSGNYTITVTSNTPASTEVLNCGYYEFLDPGQPKQGYIYNYNSTASSYSCQSTLNFSSEEKVYLYYNYGEPFTITLSGLSTNNTDVLLLSSCSVTDCVAYGDNQISYNGAPGWYYIIVDGHSNASGYFTIEVNIDDTPPIIEEEEEEEVNGTLNCLSNTQLYNGITQSSSNYLAENVVFDYSCSEDAAGGGEVIFQYQHTGGLLTASLGDGLLGILGVYILSSCDPSSCIAYGDQTASTNALAGTYYIVVDGPSQLDGYYYNFNITASSGTSDSPLECWAYDAYEWVSDGNSYDRSTSSSNYSNASNYSCSNIAEYGPEKVFIYSHEGGDLTASLTNVTGGDLNVYILTYCDASSCIDYGDESVTISATPGYYYIVVDGDTAGDFTLSVNSGTPIDNSGVIGETGKVNVNQLSTNQWHSVLLDNNYFNPVVIMQSLTNNDAGQAVVKVKSITSNGFQFKIDEWGNQDDVHSNEDLSYIVVEAGSHTLEDGTKIQAGYSSAAKQFVNVNYPMAFSGTPVVVSQIVSTNNAFAVNTRQQNITSSGFQLKAQSDEATYMYNYAVNQENIGWIAIESGSGNSNGQKFDAAATPNYITDYYATIMFNEGVLFDAPPVMVNAMQTCNGNDPSSLRHYGLTNNYYVVKIEEEQTYDFETSHIHESIGYIAFAEGLMYGAMNSFKSSQEEVTLLPSDNLAILSIYPNPAKRDFKIIANSHEGCQEASLSIFDINGAMVYTNTIGKLEANLARTIEVNNHYLHPGVYIISLHSEKGILNSETLIITEP